jgi:hypothetical protein
MLRIAFFSLLFACARGGSVELPSGSTDEGQPEARSSTASDASTGDWSRSIDPQTLGAPLVEDYRACLTEAAKYYVVEDFELVKTRDDGVHRFLYFLDRSDQKTSGNHFGCRVGAEGGEILILHEG